MHDPVINNHEVYEGNLEISVPTVIKNLNDHEILIPRDKEF